MERQKARGIARRVEQRPGELPIVAVAGLERPLKSIKGFIKAAQIHEGETLELIKIAVCKTCVFLALDLAKGFGKSCLCFLLVSRHSKGQGIGNLTIHIRVMDRIIIILG